MSFHNHLWFDWNKSCLGGLSLVTLISPPSKHVWPAPQPVTVPRHWEQLSPCCIAYGCIWWLDSSSYIFCLYMMFLSAADVRLSLSLPPRLLCHSPDQSPSWSVKSPLHCIPCLQTGICSVSVPRLTDLLFTLLINCPSIFRATF